MVFILNLVDEFDRDKTSIIRNPQISRRNLGSFQMTMDTAAICTYLIIKNGIHFSSIPFIDRPLISINENESIQLNFRYLLKEDGSPLISEKIIALLKKDEFDLKFIE